MTWLKLDDGFTRHPRMVAAGLHGRALFIAGLCYCGTHLTDGRIPRAAFPMLCAEAGVPGKTWRTLLEVGSWIDHGDHIEVHDFLVYNPSRAKVLADREAGAERQRKARESRRDRHRDESVTDGVSPRDPTRPDPIDLSSSNGSSKAPVDDDVETVLESFADLQRKRNARVTNVANWRKAVIANARSEHGPTIRKWLDEYDLPASAIAAGLIDGPRGDWSHHRKVTA